MTCVAGDRSVVFDRAFAGTVVGAVGSTTAVVRPWSKFVALAVPTVAAVVMTAAVAADADTVMTGVSLLSPLVFYSFVPVAVDSCASTVFVAVAVVSVVSESSPLVIAVDVTSAL